MEQFIIIFLISLCVSIISGILGLGGAVILIPAYLYLPQFFGADPLDIKTISGLTSVQVFASSLLGVLIHKKHGSVEKSLLYTIGIPMAAAALLGAVFSKFVRWKYYNFSFCNHGSCRCSFNVYKNQNKFDDNNPGEVNFNKSLALIISIIVGLFGGMVGAPGAFLLAPLNDYSFKNSC